MKTLAKVFEIIIAAIVFFVVFFTVLLYPVVAVTDLMERLHVDGYGPLIVMSFSHTLFWTLLIMGVTIAYINQINKHWKS